MKNIFVGSILTSVFLAITVGQSLANEIDREVVQPQLSVPTERVNIPPSTPPSPEFPNCWWWCNPGTPDHQDMIRQPRQPINPEQLNENLQQQQIRNIQQPENSQQLK